MSDFLLLTAPPGAGKTRLLFKLIESFSLRDDVFIIVSPLRIIVEELKGSLQKEGVPCDEITPELTEFGKRVYLGTCEKISSRFFSQIQKKKRKPIVILDEIHLFFEWSKTFRPILWQKMIDSLSLGGLVIGLSATFEKQMKDEVQKTLSSQLGECIHIDYGNQSLRNLPNQIHLYGDRMKPLFFKNIKVKNKRGVKVIFVKRRCETQSYARYFISKGQKTLTCVGGEVKEFQQALKESPDVEVIISTTALSHGVNLPRIESLFITYPTGSRSHWVQMVGRGGRKGENFSLHCFDQYLYPRWREFGLILLTILRTVWPQSFTKPSF